MAFGWNDWGIRKELKNFILPRVFAEKNAGSRGVESVALFSIVRGRHDGVDIVDSEKDKGNGIGDISLAAVRKHKGGGFLAAFVLVA